MIRRRRAVKLALVALAFAGCRPSATDLPAVPDLAGLTQARHPAFHPRDWAPYEPMGHLDFSGREHLAGWQLGDWDGGWQPLAEAPHSISPTGELILAEPEARYWLMRDLGGDEQALRKLRFEIDGTTAGDLFTACWRCRGQDWSCRPITVGASGAFEPEVEVEPTDVLEAIKFQLTTIRGRRVRLRSLELFRKDWSRLAVAPGPWRITLGEETRDGFVSRVRNGVLAPLARTSDVLELGVGLSADTRGGLAFEVIARDARGDRVLARHELPSSAQAAAVDRWHDVTVPLEEISRGEELLLALRAPAAEEAKRGFAYWSVPAQRTAPRKPDVLLISLDTVRADRMSLYGYERPTTPGIDAWASERAMVFDHAVAPAPWTLPSHASVFTGLDAHRHGTNIEGPLPSELPTLAELLRQAGYEARASTVGPVLAPHFGLDRGFSRFRVRGMLSLPVAASELDGGVEDVLRWLREGRHRLDFVFLHTYQAHDPHAIEDSRFAAFAGGPVEPGAYVTPGVPRRDEMGRTELEWTLISQSRPTGRLLDPDGDRALLGALYDSGLARLDAKISGLLAKLDEEGLADDLVVVLFSDHGESLLERGLAGHHHLYEENLHVPLALSAPGLSRPGRVDTPVSLVDVLPTLLELAGVGPLRGIDGISLAGTLAGRSPRGRPLWSYAASSNRGFAVRRSRAEKVLFPSSAWTSVRERGVLVRLDEDPLEERPIPLPPTQQAELQSAVAERIAMSPSTLRVQLDNRGPEPWVLVLRGEGVHPGGVESPAAPIGCCSFGGDWLRARLEPGARYDLQLADRHDSNPRVEIGTLGGIPAFEADEHEAVFVLQAGSWRRAGQHEGPALARVRFTRGGSRGADPGIDEDGARERLKALGYVE